MEANLYHYRARVTSAYDGDTITVTVDLGFHFKAEEMKFRLWGIDTPEIRGGTEQTKQAARDARDRLKDLVLDRDVVIQTFKDKKGKYGRYLARVWAKVDSDRYENINLLLVAEGHAETASY